jgi:hypothetical protein
MLEYDQGASPKAQVDFLAAFAQFAVSNNAAITTHGNYSADGAIGYGQCKKLTDVSSDGIESVNVGNSLTVSHGAARVNFLRSESNGQSMYTVDSAQVPYVSSGLAKFGERYSITVSGSDSMPAQKLEGTLFLPQKMEGGTPTQILSYDFLDGTQALPIQRGQPFEVTWNPGEQAIDGVFIRFHDSAGVPLTVCLSENTGSFTVPAEVVDAQLDSGNIAMGYLLEESYPLHFNSITYDFRTVGSSCVFGRYIKQ